jgi:hypothetical protein
MNMKSPTVESGLQKCLPCQLSMCWYIKLLIWLWPDLLFNTTCWLMNNIYEPLSLQKKESSKRAETTRKSCINGFTNVEYVHVIMWTASWPVKRSGIRKGRIELGCSSVPLFEIIVQEVHEPLPKLGATLICWASVPAIVIFIHCFHILFIAARAPNLTK